MFSENVEIRNNRCELISGSDISFFEGKLKTFIETLGLKEGQEKASKDVLQTLIWDWFNYITNNMTDHLVEKKKWYIESRLVKTQGDYEKLAPYFSLVVDNINK